MIMQSMLVSRLVTPKEFISKDERGIEYPDPEYMRWIADKYFPGWSWIYPSPPSLVMGSDGLPVEIVVYGRLQFLDEIVGEAKNSYHRQGDMVASHRIQRPSKDTTKLMDMGNDVKAANTDCLKKAWNIYMHICDDVYRWNCPEITDREYRTLKNLIGTIKSRDIKDTMLMMMDNGLAINSKNYGEAERRVKSQLEKEKNE